MKHSSLSQQSVQQAKIMKSIRDKRNHHIWDKLITEIRTRGIITGIMNHKMLNKK